MAEACSLVAGQTVEPRTVLRMKIKVRSERAIPLPDDVREAFDEYLKLDRGRQRNLHRDGPEQFICQLLANCQLPDTGVRQAALDHAGLADQCHLNDSLARK